MNDHQYDKLTQLTDSANILYDEPMNRHTTFKVGGCADCFVSPKSIKEAAEIVRLLLHEKIPFYIVGNGSNLLVSDKGYRGCIVNIGKGLSAITREGHLIKAEAGAILSKVCTFAANNNLDGMIFASGIPGSVGGAMVMNAGAYGGEMKDIVKEVSLLDFESGDIVTLNNEEMHFDYRSSIVKTHPYMVLSAVFELKDGRREEIEDKMKELAARRREKQPLEYPSAGSTFKRPEGYFAGKLIEDAGLRGYSVGNAMVSEKHCGFVINKGGATADDITSVIRFVRKKVYDDFSVDLKPEVCMLGEDITI